MENFYNLRAEKQEHIINAALTVFSRLTYKKASTADIAAEAGIAKGMVFYYFGSKKNLYLYLIQSCYKTVLEAIDSLLDKTVTDYFDRIVMVTEIKIAVMKKNPAILGFLANVYHESDPEVAEDIIKIISGSDAVRANLLYEGVDTSKFKDDIDPRLIEKFLVWAGEGWSNSVSGIENVDAFIKDFYDCIAIMKKYFYKNN